MMKKHAVPIPVSGVHVEDSFFAPRMLAVRSGMLPYQWEALNDRLPDTEPSHSMSNFRSAAGFNKAERRGPVFQDSDLYKWLEAVAFALEAKPDEALRAYADEAISVIEAAQQPDGYLNTYFQLVCPEKRWTNLQDHHELYCAGHLIEAAVAYHRATGDEKLLNVAIRFADLIDSTFGVGEGKINGYPGHEVIELALVKLSHLTGDAKYLRLAKYFVDQRGQSPLYFKDECEREGRAPGWGGTHMKFQYYQAGRPVREQSVAEGHAVRAAYLYAGMADVARETGDEELMQTCRTLFDNISTKQMYITGAIGQTEVGEAFSYDYDLPNDTAYAETCAQIGLCFFAQRMLISDVDSRYSDVLERALYNGVLSGMSLDAMRFFYVNPLEVSPTACELDELRRHVKYQRQGWFSCACCPPNIARMLSSVSSYAYAASDDTLYMHLFVGGHVKADLNGRTIEMRVQTEYPWRGDVLISLQTAGAYTLAIRVPHWCRDWTLRVNGEAVEAEPRKGYVYLNRAWSEGDFVEFVMDMPVQTLRANPRVREDIGKLSVTRGPIVYCIEQADNGPELHRIALRRDAVFTAEDDPELLGRVVVLRCEAKRQTDEGFKQGALYAATEQALDFEDIALTLIPYYAWTNRAPGEMLVWIREA